MGTGGALRLALPQIHSEGVLILNGDSYCDTRLNDFATWHGDRTAPATILLTKEDDTRRFGRLEVDTEGRILEFHEKATTNGPGWNNSRYHCSRLTYLDAGTMLCISWRLAEKSLSRWPMSVNFVRDESAK